MPDSTDNVQQPAPAPRRRIKYVPAVGPRLKVLLLVVFGLVALLGANAVYLSAITFMEWWTGNTYQNYFYQYMFLAHLVLGLLLILPLVAFGFIHMFKARGRRNRRAVRVGYALFIAAIVVLVSGVLLMRVAPLEEFKSPTGRTIVYWLHIAAPLLAGWLYWLHRLAGPKIKWRLGISYGGAVAAVCLVMVLMHSQDPRQWNVIGPAEGEKYFFPSLARTADGGFIPGEAMMNDQYCMQCHADIHADWSDSVHRFSSFNNAAYLAAVRETREFSMNKQGDVKRARWCAGCHDPVPFFSGAFDDPKFDDVNHPTARAGITCTTCHAITHVNSARGNADYTIEQPLHYPFAFSEDPLLQWVNRQLIKAKPSFHKKTFLKPLHKTTEFCSTCHKVHLPPELNDYKWLRGQNHYDAFLLSGVSGHGARSFYYPPKAQENCNGCHMPLKASNDFGAQHFDNAEELSVHNHLFPSANTGVAHMRGRGDIVEAHQAFLKDVMRVDIFGLREGTRVSDPLTAPIRPQIPTLKPGGRYVLETVIRTMKMGHLFTQGTVDSNEVWLDVTVTSNGEVIGRNGGMDEVGRVDPWSHFVNVFMLDRDGNRISRRNPQDIFVPLYNHQIPPGAGQTVHYGLELPPDVTGPVTVEVKLQYRKFDWLYMQFVKEKTADAKLVEIKDGPHVNDLPVTTLAVDRVTFAVEGFPTPEPVADRGIPQWQRWNDYGIGLLLKGGAQLRQAAEAFAEVEKLGKYHGPLNLARVHYNEGELDKAVDALKRAAAYKEPENTAPWWTVAWLIGLVNSQQGHLEEAAENLRSVLEDRTPEMVERGFDFSLDYPVRNQYADLLFKIARTRRDPAEREVAMRKAAEHFGKTLQIDSENATAHYNLALIHEQLGEKEKAAEHQALHQRYKTDDNARDRALELARRKYPAANHASAESVIYPLHRAGAPGLPAGDKRAVAQTGE